MPSARRTRPRWWSTRRCRGTMESCPKSCALRPAAGQAAGLTVLANKIDLLGESQAARVVRELASQTGLDVLGTSAVTGAGLEAVRRRLATVLSLETDRSDTSLALHQRQRMAAEAAAAALTQAARAPPACATWPTKPRFWPWTCGPRWANWVQSPARSSPKTCWAGSSAILRGKVATTKTQQRKPRMIVFIVSSSCRETSYRRLRSFAYVVQA